MRNLCVMGNYLESKLILSISVRWAVLIILWNINFICFCLASNEVTKLQQHLALLKEEYSKLQIHCAEIERKYTLAAASAGDLSETSFVARLLMTVSTLYGRETYSDINIKLQNKSVPAHKFVLNARSDDWNEAAIKNLTELGKILNIKINLILFNLWIFVYKVNCTINYSTYYLNL